MHFTSFLASTLALAGSVAPTLATSSFDFSPNLGRRSHEHLHRDAFSSLGKRSPKPAGGPSKSGSASPISSSGPNVAVDLKKWAEDTTKVCDQAMSELSQASNPAGLSICYNMPFLNRQDGVFQAELRVYKVAEATGPWQNVDFKDISVLFSYLGATVQVAPGTNNKRDEEEVRTLSVQEFDVPDLDKRQSSTPQHIKTVMYIGQTNSNIKNTKDKDLQPLLTPNVGLSSTDPKTGDEITTQLSAKDASFLNGVFSKAQTPAVASAAASESASASAIAASATVFVLPGTTFGIFPTGMIITVIWATFFIGFVGLGTLGRVQFRYQYRRRKQAQSAEGIRTI